MHPRNNKCEGLSAGSPPHSSQRGPATNSLAAQQLGGCSVTGSMGLTSQYSQCSRRQTRQQAANSMQVLLQSIHLPLSHGGITAIWAVKWTHLVCIDTASRGQQQYTVMALHQFSEFSPECSALQCRGRANGSGITANYQSRPPAPPAGDRFRYGPTCDSAAPNCEQRVTVARVKRNDGSPTAALHTISTLFVGLAVHHGLRPTACPHDMRAR